MMSIDEILAPVYGKFCWNARKGYGSFLTFEFGNPHVDSHERNRSQNGIIEKIRRVAVYGDWHLWIYLCDWTIFSHDVILATNSSKAGLIHRAMHRLEGQILSCIEIFPNCSTTFVFELGDRLETIPNLIKYGSESEQWMLYEPLENVFTLRADQKYSYESGKTSQQEKHWQWLG